MNKVPPKALYNLMKRRLQVEPPNEIWESERSFLMNEMLKINRTECPSCGRPFDPMAQFVVNGNMGEGSIECPCGQKFDIAPQIKFTGYTTTSTGTFTGSW